MNVQRLAPSIAMINVVGIDIELHFVIQVIPSTTAPNISKLPLQPYQIRRNFEDFLTFHQMFIEKLSKEFIVKDDIVQHPLLGRINQVPRLPEVKQYPDFKTHTQRVKELNQYVKHLLLLQPEIFRRAPIPEFFGEWPKDSKTKDQLETPPLNGTYDLDILVGNSPHSASSSLKSLPTPSPPPKVIPKETVQKPTFEEFVSDLAKNLGVEMDEKRASLDTVMDSPELRHKVNSIQSVATVLDVPRKAVKTVQSMDTVVSSPLAKTVTIAKSLNNIRDTVVETSPVRQGLEEGRFRSRDTVADDMAGNTLTRPSNDRDTIIEPDLIRSNTSKSDSTAINDTVDVLEVIKERKALQERMRGHSRQRSNGSLRKDEIPKRQPPTMKIDTTIDRSNSPVANISIPSRKESRNWNSGDSPAQKQLNIIPGLKSPAYPILLSPFSASLDRDSSNRSAESRSHSRSNSDSLHRSKSGSDKISDSYPSLGRDRNTLIKESLGTLLKATKRRESPSDDMNREEIIDQSLDTIRRGTAKRMHQSASDNTPTLDYDHLDEALTLRIVLSTSQPLYLTVERTISFDQVLDQVSTLIAESRPSRKWRMLPPPREYMVAVQHLSYRTPDLDLVTIHSDQDWDLCRYHARQIEKLTLFVTVHEHK